MKPDTPIWDIDIVDRCRVCESHADTEARRLLNRYPREHYRFILWMNRGVDDWMVAAVTVPLAVQEQLETLLRWLILTPVVPALPPKPLPTELESFLQRLLMGVQAPKPAPPDRTGITNMETLLQSLLPGTPVPT